MSASPPPKPTDVALREQLARTAGPALEMVQGRRPLETPVVLDALEAAGLLGVELALPGIEVVLAGVEAGTTLDEHLRLAGIARASGDARIRGLVERASLEVLLHPEVYVEDAERALELWAALDLDEDHPAETLLQAVIEAPAVAAAPFDAEVAREGFSRARRTLGLE